MSATENVDYVRGGMHRVPLLAVTLLLRTTECQDPQPLVPLPSSARPDKRNDLKGLFAPRVFREYCHAAVHTENSIQRFSARNDIVTFRLPGECALSFIFLNIADFKGIRAGMQFGEGQQHLAALRHGKIAFITGPLTLKSARARKEAFVQSMNEIGMEPEPQLVVEGDHTLEGGQQAFTKLWALKARPTAILCSNDMTAIGVMRESYGKKIPIPGELSVIGFDNIHLAQYILPPLTTIEMSQAQLGRLAFQALLSDVRRESPNPKGTEYVLKTSFVLRDSTAMNSRKRLS